MFATSRLVNATVTTCINKHLSTYSQRIDDTVHKGRAWKTSSCICSCQLFIKLEVCYGDCWKLRCLLEARFGKSSHISMISNSVTHLRSYTNSAIADIAVNSSPISPVTPRDRRRLRIERRRLRIKRQRLRIQRRYRIE